MFGKLLGAFIGRQIDRRDGKGGVKGAVMGAAAAGLIRRAGPIGLIAGGAWLAKKHFDKRKAEKAYAEARAADYPPTV